MSHTRTFSITPQGRFSLAQANAFGFGQRSAADGGQMALAFAVDGDYEPAGVELTQSRDGVVHGTVHGDAGLDAVRDQTARVLSLDHDGRAWERILEQEPPLASLDARVPGLRPVLFHSPYEAAAWSIISARIHRTQAAKIRDDLATTLGTTYELHGEPLHAFPSPERLIDGLDRWGGLNETKRSRLLELARAADDGQLDAAALQSLGPDAATARLLTLKGIGPFYASLITIRATGFTDMPVAEPRARGAALCAYGRPTDTSDADWLALMDRWKPFRIWATVLCRVALDRGYVAA
jgi:DNA-3-methyladenine glycosylase II